MEIKKTYRPDEVAVMLNLSKRTINRMIKKGLLSTTPGYPRRIPAEALKEIFNDLERVQRPDGSGWDF